MKSSLTILFLLIYVAVFSQKDSKFGVPYYYCNWTNVCLNKQYVPTEKDTCLFVISTRNYDATKKEFVDYDYDSTGTLKYFALYYQGNNWVAVPHTSLNELLNLKSTFKNLVIFTEGLGKTFTSGVDRATMMMRTYDVDELFFDWPTDRPYMRPGKNIKVTCSIAPEVAKPYASFLEEFQNYKNNHSGKFKAVTLFFHSMGNLLLMYDLKNDLFKNISPTLVNSVVLNAACVNQTHHKEWLDKLSFSKHIYLTINHKDRNLRGASIIFADHQLGEKPKPEFCTTVNYVDFSEVLHKEHNYYLMPEVLKSKPFLKKFYADIFEDKIPQLKFINTEISEEVKKYLPGYDSNGISTGM
ncbi:MAG: alpha/beta hydrolase [Bacteroidetes bacterium]|nr:alpha/beta hydrolase [Bacteroidota bacterium]